MKSRTRFCLAKKPLALAVLSAIALMGSGPGGAAVVNWIGTTGSWHTATNWSSNPLFPGAADDVVINVAGVQTITHSTGTSTINTLAVGSAANPNNNLALTGGTLVVNTSATITGGTLTISGGTLSGAGAVSVNGAGSWTNGGMTGAGSTTFNGPLTLSGNGLRDIHTGARSVNFAGTTTWTNTAGGNAGQFRTGPGVTLTNSGTWLDQTAFDTSINAAFGGGTFVNTGTYTKSGAPVTTIGVGFNNAATGIVNVNAGTLVATSLQGAGTLQIGAAGVANLISTNSTVGTLQHNGTATGSLNLGAVTITVSSDYNNANFGTGDAFNRRANVLTSGIGNRIVAAGNAAQAITGAGVTNGNTANATLTLGNVRVGATTFNYQVANTGTTGPSLRGAIQTSVNGGNLTDARLSGAGVTASNFNTGAPGSNTGNLGVTFTAASAGTLAPLTGQALNLRSNFDNIADQKLNIVLGAGAAAYQAATGAIQSAPLNFGTVQVGQLVNQSLVIRNTATGAAGFVEDLNASFGSTGGTGASLISGTGTLSGILAGTNSSGANGAMTVTVNTAAAGTVAGNIAVNYQTVGAVNSVSNGLGTASAGSEAYAVNGVINATANVINQASPLVNTPTINLGAVRVGAAAPTANVSITNVATVAPQAALNASIASNGAPVTAAGSFNLLSPGATNSGSLQVGLNTANAGNFTGANAGSATISFVSDASNIGNCAPNCQLSIASQTVSVSGKVYTAAVGQLNTAAVNFGIVRVGDVVAAQNIGVQNTATATALNDTLRANLGGVGGAFTGTNTVGGITAGGAGNITVGLNTGAAGIFNQNGAVSFLSQNADMADASAGANQPVLVTAQVNNHANGAFSLVSGLGALTLVGTDWVLDLGNVALNSNVSDTVKLKNDTTGPADDLSGVFDLTLVDDFIATGFGPVNGLAAGQSSGNLNLNFAALSLGLFQDIIDFDGFGTNASDPTGVAQQRRLIIRANVFNANQVPEPGTLALLLVAAAAAVMARRRRIIVK